MMNDNLFHGKLVRLATMDAKTAASAFNRWMRDSEYWRLMSSGPAVPYSTRSVEQWIEKDQENDPPRGFGFLIYTLECGRLVGEIGLDGVRWRDGDTFVGISIGSRDDWGKGYGTDAMRIILRYAFDELNLKRVTLNVFAYNPRAIRSYEKAGFKLEGCQREALHKDGQRYDILYMGILREDWMVDNVHTGI